MRLPHCVSRVRLVSPKIGSTDVVSRSLESANRSKKVMVVVPGSSHGAGAYSANSGPTDQKRPRLWLPSQTWPLCNPRVSRYVSAGRGTFMLARKKHGPEHGSGRKRRWLTSFIGSE